MPKIAESALLFRVYWGQQAFSDSDGELRSMQGAAGVGEGAGAYRSAITPAVRRRRPGLCPFSTSFAPFYFFEKFSEYRGQYGEWLTKFQINPKP